MEFYSEQFSDVRETYESRQRHEIGTYLNHHEPYTYRYATRNTTYSIPFPCTPGCVVTVGASLFTVTEEGENVELSAEEPFHKATLNTKTGVLTITNADRGIIYFYPSIKE